MKNIHDLVIEKSAEIAKNHAFIIEKECKSLCEKYSCTSDDLIIEYHLDATIKINVKGVYLKIHNKFIIESIDQQELNDRYGVE